MHPAPGPEEVNWQHLWLSWRQRDLRGALTWPLLVAVVIFPITLFTSAVAQLQFVICPQSKDGSTVSSAQVRPYHGEIGRGTGSMQGACKYGAEWNGLSCCPKP